MILSVTCSPPHNMPEHKDIKQTHTRRGKTAVLTGRTSERHDTHVCTDCYSLIIQHNMSVTWQGWSLKLGPNKTKTMAEIIVSVSDSSIIIALLHNTRAHTHTHTNQLHSSITVPHKWHHSVWVVVTGNNWVFFFFMDSFTNMKVRTLLLDLCPSWIKYFQCGKLKRDTSRVQQVQKSKGKTLITDRAEAGGIGGKLQGKSTRTLRVSRRGHDRDHARLQLRNTWTRRRDEGKVL